MNNYKFLFDNGAIVSCSIADVEIPDGNGNIFIQRDEKIKHIVYIIVHAESELQAYKIVEEILYFNSR